MAASFKDILRLMLGWISVPRGRFMVTKSANVKFRVTQTESEVGFKVTQDEEMVKFQLER